MYLHILIRANAMRSDLREKESLGCYLAGCFLSSFGVVKRRVIGSTLCPVETSTWDPSKSTRGLFEPPVVPVLDWMNTGPLSICGWSGGLVVQGTSGETNDWLGAPPHYVGAVIQSINATKSKRKPDTV